MLHELEDEQIDVDLDQEADLTELDGRRIMIRLEQIDRAEKKLKATKAAVVATYDERLQGIAEERERYRSSLRALVFRFGKIAFPDVGTAYKRKTDPKIEIVDQAAFEAELGAMFIRDVFDTTAAKTYALDRALEDGILVAGTELVPAGEDIAVRKA